MIDVIPERYQLLAGGICLALGAAATGLVGWQLKGMQADTEISSLKANYAAEREQNAQAALVSLKEDAAAVHKAAIEYAAIETTLAPKIAALTKELRNAPKLPDNCRPDLYRVRNLETAIDAANQSIAR